MAKKKNKGQQKRRRRSTPKAKPTRRRRRGSKVMSGWIPLAIALAGGEVMGNTLLAKLPAILNPQAVTVWLAGHFTNRPHFKEIAYAIQAASMAGPLKEQATKMLAGMSLGGAKTAGGTRQPTVAEAAQGAPEFVADAGAIANGISGPDGL